MLNNSSFALIEVPFDDAKVLAPERAKHDLGR